MTSEQAQQLYDHCGSLKRLGELLGCGVSKAHGWAVDHGVKVNSHSGSTRKLFVKSVHCEEMKRPCVLMGMGECPACRARMEPDGISSNMEIGNIRW